MSLYSEASGRWNNLITNVHQHVNRDDFFCRREEILNARKNGYSPNERIFTDFKTGTSPSLFISYDESPRQKVTIPMYFGGGSSKEVYWLNGPEKALFLPARTNNGIHRCWKRLVKEELAMSKFIESIGLLGLKLATVDVFISNNSEISIPSYVSKSFVSYADDNQFVVESTRSSSSFNKPVFSPGNDPSKLSTWLPCLEKMQKDIAKIVYYGLPTSGDSFHYIYIPSKSISKQDFSQIRYFGFDFSDADTPITIPKKSDYVYTSEASKRSLMKKISSMLRATMEELFYRERVNGKREISKEVEKSVTDKIVLNLSDKIFEEVSKIATTEATFNKVDLNNSSTFFSFRKNVFIAGVFAFLAFFFSPLFLRARKA